MVVTRAQKGKVPELAEHVPPPEDTRQAPSEEARQRQAPPEEARQVPVDAPTQVLVESSSSGTANSSSSAHHVAAERNEESSHTTTMDQDLDDAEAERILLEQERARHQRDLERDALIASHENEIASLRAQLQNASMSAVCGAVNGNSQPPLPPAEPVDPDGPPLPPTLLAFMADLRSEMSNVRDMVSAVAAGSRRARTSDDETEAPPARRARVNSASTPMPVHDHAQPPVTANADSSSCSSDITTIPGLSAEASRAVFNLRRNPDHPAAALTLSDISKLRLRGRTDGPDPGEKLNIGDVDKYQHWAHSLAQRWIRDWCVYLTDAEKINYSLTWLDGDLYTALDDWWTDSTIEDKTYANFLFEIETMLGVQFQSDEARRDLELCCQGKDELIRPYYGRLRALWRRAGTPETERISKLRSSIKNQYSTPILGRKFESVKELFLALLDIESDIKARSLERQRNEPSANSRAPPSKTTSSTKFSFKTNTAHASDRDRSGGDYIPSAAEMEHNNALTPVAKKPPGWKGKWWPADPNPKKAGTMQHRLLARQGRCWACRGSGHASTDSCCPYFERRHSQISSAASSNKRTGKNISALDSAPVSADNNARVDVVNVHTSDDE